MTARILLAYDGLGAPLSEAIVEELGAHGYETVLVAGSGRHDYPDLAAAACTAFNGGGYASVVLVCGTGLGMSIVANKFPGIRAARCTDEYSVEKARRHSDANVLALAANLTPSERARSLVRSWVGHRFDSARSIPKIARIASIEESERRGDRAATTPVVVLAKGLGSRLAPVAATTHKTMELIAGRPILWWLLRDLAGADALARTSVVLREADAGAAALCREFGVAVEFSSPTGYLRDVHAVASAAGTAVTVVEGDSFVQPGSVGRFVEFCGRLPADAGFAFATAAPPARWDYPIQWVGVDDRGRVRRFGRDIEPTALMACGLWHWTPAEVAQMPRAIEQGLSFTRFVADRIAAGTAVATFGVAGAHNVNTAVSLEQAREWAESTVAVAPDPAVTR
ncbi:RpiB/LacA/LacB family sugar-phosphate isomerase [Catellatospora chokoriensis]|uniref:Ribose 5-phosphate isomerase B n=1 Tax=Catellatospora chokoriensis TaxID=310353 RepID=A0A8J3K415_9ACTN|nr:RpiB/LacA/LacB family sugar-phosphate isomerase [Catellatospora chokoriensis]GIF90315.1 hypothetical protein Cch02nite_37590 [Catellatospora chokoriensis]